MTPEAIFFWLLMLEWTALGLYFLSFLVLRKPRRLINLAWAVACIGFPTVAARELHLLPKGVTSGIIILGALAGALGLIVVVTYEAQRYRPFR